jgi:hypothetical protein
MRHILFIAIMLFVFAGVVAAQDEFNLELKNTLEPTQTLSPITIALNKMSSTGFLKLSLEPPDAQIRITRKNDPLEIPLPDNNQFSVGVYTLTATKKGYVIWTKDFVIAADTTTDLNVMLKEIGIRKSHFNFGSALRSFVFPGWGEAQKSKGLGILSSSAQVGLIIGYVISNRDFVKKQEDYKVAREKYGQGNFSTYDDYLASYQGMLTKHDLAKSSQKTAKGFFICATVVIRLVSSIESGFVVPIKSDNGKRDYSLNIQNDNIMLSFYQRY